MTQLISLSRETDEPIDDVRDALVDAIGMARSRVASKAALITRIETAGPLSGITGMLAHVVTELLLDAANAFPGPIADGNVIVVTAQRIARYAVIRVSDNAIGAPRHAPALAAVVVRMGGQLRFERGPGEGASVTILIPLGDDEN